MRNKNETMSRKETITKIWRIMKDLNIPGKKKTLSEFNDEELSEKLGGRFE